MTRDADLRECFGRYALIAEVVRDPKSCPLSKEFTQRVNRLIDGAAAAGQPALEVRVAKAAGARSWWRPIAGAAVAAGVAAVAVVALERRSDVPALVAASTLPRSSLAQARLPVANAAVATASRKEALSYTVPTTALLGADRQDPAVLPAARLTNYVFAHSKYSSMLGQRNVLSGLIAEMPDSLPESARDAASASAALPSRP